MKKVMKTNNEEENINMIMKIKSTNENETNNDKSNKKTITKTIILFK